MAGQSRSKRAFVQDRIKVSPLVEAMTLALIGLASTPLLAQAATPVGSAWFSSSQGVNSAVRARAGMTGGSAGIEAARVRQQQQARLTLQRSVQNLERTAAAIAAQQASQKAARDAANAAPGNVPDGIGKGGLWDKDQNGKQLAWSGADRAVQTESGGKTTVVIKQTASKAILNWDTFNVGRNTTVNFDQNSTDAVLNRVVGDEARPSQILGAINGKGSVMVANQNGVIFSGSSQVNVRNLAVAAATITDEQFRNNGLYVDTQGTQPTFRDAKGDVMVNAGAQITTSAPASSTADGGYVLLAGANVTNAGQITTPSGQTIMAAGDSFIIRKGVGTESNAASTTAGHEVSAQRAAGSLSGRVENSGLIAATTGDITLTGHEVVQSGVAVATTSTSKRGTLHLSTRASDTTGSVTLAKGSTTAIVLDASKGTALDSQRDAALKRLDGNTPNPMATGNFDNLSTLTDRRDLSRVEIVSGNTVAFETDSMALATGGEIAVSAMKRTLVDNGATLDVSGAIGVQVAMENNNLAIDVQGNEQRDSAVNRDSQNLNSSKMWVDRRNLVFVPAGTNGYATDRWYTAGGLLEVGGYLATSGHSVGEWMAQGGTVTMSGGDLVTRSGSAINLSGGTLDVQSGNIRQSWLKGSDGRLYELSRAPGDLLYTGLYNGYELTSKRWGQTTQFYNPLIGSSQRYEAGYTVGRDAGKLVVSTRNAVLEGSIVSDVWQGDNQTRAAQQGLDGYNQLHYSVARAGQLIVGRYTPVYGNGVLRHELNPVLDRVILSDDTGTLADGVQLEDAVANERQGELRLDTDLLNDSGLGAVRIAAAKAIDVDSTLRVTPGGEIVLYAPDVEVGADLVAHSGTVRLGNVLNQTYAGAVKGETDDRSLTVPSGVNGGVRVKEGVTLDVSGLLTDLRQSESDSDRDSRMAYVDGGTVSIRSTHGVTLDKGTLIDVTSGAVALADGSLKGGKGGNVQLGVGLTTTGAGNAGAVLTLNGDIEAWGVNGSGTLQIESANALSIGGKLLQEDGVLKPGETVPVDLALLVDYEVKAGEKLPAAFAYLSQVAKPGEVVGARPDLIGLTLGAAWTLPYATGEGITFGSYTLSYQLPGESTVRTLQVRPAAVANGEVYSLPAGAKITEVLRSDNFPLTYRVPGDIFPNGIPTVEYQRIAQAGSTLDFDVKLKAGAVIKAGMSGVRDMAVSTPGQLDTGLFQSGFAHYDVRGHRGLAVTDGTTVNVTKPVWYADPDALAGGASLDEVLQTRLPDLYTPDNARRRVSQREGASLALAAGVDKGLTAGTSASGVVGDAGDLTIARGAELRVDPGQSIALSSRGSLRVDGLLEARGGTISLLGPQTDLADKTVAEGGNIADGVASQRAIHLGQHAVLDATAAAMRFNDARGNPYGRVSDGGSIIIGGTVQPAASRALASDAFVVIDRGARVDASGSSALLDMDGRGARPVASNGGDISIVSANGVYLNGSLRADAGGAGASGGTLTVALDAPNYTSRTVEQAVLAPRELRLVQQRLTGDETLDALEYGHGLLGVDQIRDGGFSTLTLFSNGMVNFDGDIDLQLNRSLNLYAGALTVNNTASRVALAAPHLLLAGITDNVALAPTLTRPSFQGGVSPLDSESILTATADLLEVKGSVTSGLNRSIGGIEVQRAGFGQMNLISRGDLRFLTAEGNTGNSGIQTELLSSGDILLRAAQIYPATGVGARVLAGRASESEYRPDGRLVIERNGTAAEMPWSVFGRLTLGAANIEQNGVLRAPLGTIILGTQGTEGKTRSLQLADGSLTSVSAAGLILPYGGTSDNVNWLYQGQKIAFSGVGQGPGVTLSASGVQVDSGAVLDLSGGGELLGAGFISGRGGSTDARYNPLVQTGRDGFSLPGLATNPVYAIIPGYSSAYAPADGTGAVAPLTGQQITLQTGDIPGLPAGRYTLLPSSYALLPGAFRVEFNGAPTGQINPGAVAMRNGSWSGSGVVNIANTGVSGGLANQLIITPADVLRRYSQYNESSYADFALAQAKLRGSVRAVLPMDAKTLKIQLPSTAGSTLNFAGLVDYTPAKGGYGGTASLETVNTVAGRGAIEILGEGARPTAGFNGASVYARDLNAIGADRLTVGGTLISYYDTPGGDNVSNYLQVKGSTGSIIMRSGAQLAAPEVFLFAINPTNGITLEAGAEINTIGQGRVAYDSTDGYVYMPRDTAVLAVSNGWIDMLAPEADADAGSGAGSIVIGRCSGVCNDTTRLYSEGSLLAATLADFELGEAVRYGTRNLMLAVGTVNAGSNEDLAAAAARGALTKGLTLNQSVLDRLLQGDRAYGAPALERLILTAGESLNFFGNVTLNTLDRAGGASLDNLVLTTPAIYGYGDAGDVATISTRKLTWAGAQRDAPAPVVGGRGNGNGNLVVDAQVVEFGYDESARPDSVTDDKRTILGFNNVLFAASDRVTSNKKGTLNVYRSQSVNGDGTPRFEGGNLTLSAPLITGKGGSVNRITAGGALQLTAPEAGAGSTAGVTAQPNMETGAELDLKGASILIDTAVALPSGKLTATADGDITLADSAWLDLAGRALKMFDTTRYSWGGDVILKSNAGNIVQRGGSIIDLSAQNNRAGQLSAIALADNAGMVDLQGRLLATASGRRDMGGTTVPYLSGSADIRARTLGNAGSLSDGFAVLNERLNDGGFLGERRFQLKEGDLTIGNGLKGHAIAVSLDDGHLTVAGTIDASGEEVGSIRLAAARGLTVASGAVLDAHGTALRVDSYGKVIDSPNRAVVELDSGSGTLTLSNNVRIDLRHGTASAGRDGQSRGVLDLYAPRIDSAGKAGTPEAATWGDIAIDARSGITVQGARSIAVYGRQVYSDAPYGTDKNASNTLWQEVTQGWLDGKHDEAERFIDKAVDNSDLLDTRLAGLYNPTYAEAFHLRPAIEVVSATPDGDIIVRGDLDLSGYRYASLNPLNRKTTIAGSGEVGQLTLRAGGDLSIFGSINDGFAPPTATPDDEGWLLTPGVQAFAGDVVVPVAGVTLAEGTKYPAGKTLNYAITAKNVTLPSGTTLPVAVILDSAMTLPSGTVLAGNVLAADGSVLLAAGSVVGTDGLVVPQGATLQAGVRLPQAVTLASLIWPKGVKLPVDMVQSGALTLPVGALIASGTSVVLPDNALSVDLRPKDSMGKYIARSNWAVAEMLPAGSQSWDLRITAGADTQAADRRLTRDDGGILQLADTHYIVQKVTELTGGPVWYWAPGNYMQYEAGTPVNFEDLGGYDICGLEPGQCVEVEWVWAAGNFYFGTAGKPVDFEDLGGYDVCTLEPGQCVYVGTPKEEKLVKVVPESPIFSVLRTGTGDLDLAAGGDIAMQSPYGVYTAGTQTLTGDLSLDAVWNQARGLAMNGSVLGDATGDKAAEYEKLVRGGSSLYQAWYPDQGGNLWLDAGGTLTGDAWSANGVSGELRQYSTSVGNWLWRQGGSTAADGAAVPTAWWINFGTYALPQAASQEDWPIISGFTGLGTLGGGNVRVRVGGDVGTIETRSTKATDSVTRSQGVVLAVGSSGRVLNNGDLLLTGGGDLDVQIGGGWNSDVRTRLKNANGTDAQSHELYGALINLRGNTDMTASQVGTIELIYGLNTSGTVANQDEAEVRPASPYTASLSQATGGVMLIEGDSRATINSRGDLVFGGTADAGLVNMGYSANDGATSGVTGQSWFSLWTDNTGINLHSVGGNLAFDTRTSVPHNANETQQLKDYAPNGGWYLLPGNVSAAADRGSIYYGSSLAYNALPASENNPVVGSLLSPRGTGTGTVALLAGQSLYGGGYTIASSGADVENIASVFQPAFYGSNADGSITTGNTSPYAPATGRGLYPLFAFGTNTIGQAAGRVDSAQSPSRFYALNGDIIGLRTGATLQFADAGIRAGQTDYVGRGPVAIRAGRDIVSTGTRSDATLPVTGDLVGDGLSLATATGNLIVHSHTNDVSVIQAGRDILYATVDVAGPGTLDISAGRNMIQNDTANLKSIGPVVTGDARTGAGIVVQAGVGSSGINYDGLLAQYLDPDNRADASRPLAEQPGKVVKTYESELVAWLAERYGFSGSVDEAMAMFAGLAAEQQHIFARQIYFAELREGGREYNDASGPRPGSYLRGRSANDTLFPSHDNQQVAITYSGDLLMYGGSGIHTNVGGDIQVLTPGGGQTYGVEGEAPPATAGLITRGKGNIQLYSRDSILLGQSRIMTTFGGNILAWSAQGDINAGRGSRTTVVFTPPRRLYDNVGNVTISPDVPSTGAGIATLNPIAEVEAGDVDLIAPVGTIDAGEAGIRVSGNVNIAALQVVNAANIQVQGESSGVPVIAAVNVGALSSASSAASSATQAAQDVVRQQQAAARQGQRSTVSVQVIGFGDQPL